MGHSISRVGLDILISTVKRYVFDSCSSLDINFVLSSVARRRAPVASGSSVPV
jgi:hypothetical protein